MVLKSSLFHLRILIYAFSSPARAKKTRNTISLLPLESLVLETDSPDMPLNGYQGQKNHPKKLPITLNELIMLRNESEQTVAKQLYRNSLSAYNILD